MTAFSIFEKMLMVPTYFDVLNTNSILKMRPYSYFLRYPQQNFQKKGYFAHANFTIKSYIRYRLSGFWLSLGALKHQMKLPSPFMKVFFQYFHNYATNTSFFWIFLHATRMCKNFRKKLSYSGRVILFDTQWSYPFPLTKRQRLSYRSVCLKIVWVAVTK